MHRLDRRGKTTASSALFHFQEDVLFEQGHCTTIPICPILPDFQLLEKVDDVAQPLVEGDRVQAGDGGEGPGGLRHSPQGWSCSLPVSTVTTTILSTIFYFHFFFIPPFSCYLIETGTIFQTDQRHLSRLCEKDQHDEGAVQAEGEHRDVPQGLRGIRPQGARPLPGEKPESIAE